MLNASQWMESSNPRIRKVASYESIFKSTMSFAEEVADALCLRAGNIGKSHPSVIIGKERRLVDDLMHVAEAVRTANTHKMDNSKKEPDLQADSEKLLEDTEKFIEAEDLLKRNVMSGDCEETSTEVRNTLIKPENIIQRSPMSITDNGSSSQPTGETWTDILMDNAFSVPPKESTHIHMRLALDSREMDDLPETGQSAGRRRRSCKGPRYVPLDMPQHQIPSRTISHKRRTPIKFLSKKKREALRSFIQAKLRYRSKSENGLPVGSRIRDFINRDNIKTARKRLQGAFNSSIKTAEVTFNRIKGSLMATMRK